MRSTRWLALVALVALTLAAPTLAEDETARGDSRPTAETAGGKAAPPGGPSAQVAANMPVFVPPNRGAPQSRLGGATRSASNSGLPRIEALVPQEPGWTLEEQPVLYWHLERPTDVRVEFVLMRLEPHEVLVDTVLPRPAHGGVQRIALADHGVELEPGVSYQWLVKLAPKPDDDSYDRIVGGGIERVETPPELAARLAEAGASRANVLAQAGIWYDAVDALSRQIDAHPGNAQLLAQRTALFAQVGLPEEAR